MDHLSIIYVTVMTISLGLLVGFFLYLAIKKPKDTDSSSDSNTGLDSDADKKPDI